MTSAHDTAIVFAKPAIPGAVKTRLIPPLTAEQAAEFHLAALSDVLDVVRRITPRLRLLVAGDAAAIEDFRRRHPDIEIEAQVGADLGARVSRAFDDTFRSGARRVVLVGSDHPSLPPSYLVRIFDRLESRDVVIGPSEDGGYYAVGIRRDGWPAAKALFVGIPWSTPDVLQETLDRARTARIDFELAPTWYDVDRPEDLERLRRDAPATAAVRYLHALKRPGSPP